MSKKRKSALGSDPFDDYQREQADGDLNEEAIAALEQADVAMPEADAEQGAQESAPPSARAASAADESEPAASEPDDQAGAGSDRFVLPEAVMLPNARELMDEFLERLRSDTGVRTLQADEVERIDTAGAQLVLMMVREIRMNHPDQPCLIEPSEVLLDKARILDMDGEFGEAVA